MASTVKCRYCGEKIDKEKAYSPKKGRYYCNEEHFNLSSTYGECPKDEQNEVRNYTDYLLNIYLQEGYDRTFPNWKVIMSQTNNILANNPKWDYDTIIYIIWYMKEILEKTIISKEGNWSPLSLVEYYSKDANNFCLEKSELENGIEDFDFNKESIVIKGTSKERNKHKEINMGDI